MQIPGTSEPKTNLYKFEAEDEVGVTLELMNELVRYATFLGFGFKVIGYIIEKD
ncbi:hypothetical protein D3C80_1785100 [compost metagenome]